MAWPKLQWVKVSYCDKPSICEVDEQFVHFGLECHSRKLSQWTKNVVDISYGSQCRVVGLWVDVTSRHQIFIAS
jgi:hypothetical protein